MKTQSIALAGLLASILSAVAGTNATLPEPTGCGLGASPDTEDEWSFEIAPYVWVANIGAETSLPWNGPDQPDSVQRLDTKITGAFMIEAMARYRSLGLLLDFSWLRLDSETHRQGTLYSGANLQTDYIYATAGLTYALPLRGNFHAELLAGARLWSISSDFDMKSGTLPGFNASVSETWVSPIIGANFRYDLTPQWTLFAEGIWGGFTNSSTQWDAYAGVCYRFSDSWSGTLGYRYLSEKYETSRYTFDIDVQGAQVGLQYMF